MQKNQFQLHELSPIDFFIETATLMPETHKLEIDAHTHEKCEIYINLTGDISFMVEGNVYPVKRGCAIITKPGEWHHCIYNSSAEHKSYWILFSVCGNEALCSRFFNRKNGENNLIIPHKKERERLIELGNLLLDQSLSETKKYLYFFDLLNAIEESDSSRTPTGDIPCDVRDAISLISANCSSKITIDQLASNSHVSVKTLERHFIQYLDMTPSDYIRYKKLIQSTELLKSGKSVTDAALDCGFCDTSNYISNFKKYFKMTPLAYKNANIHI